MTRAVFLDRDGVINPMWRDRARDTVDSPAEADQFSLLPAVGASIAALNEASYLVVVVSNQPGIAKAKFSLSALQAVTERMHAMLRASGARLDGVYYCPHHPDGTVTEYRVECKCRKPRPGLILQAQRELGIDLARSIMVGDRVKDVQAGSRAGCRTVRIVDPNVQISQESAEDPDALPDWTAASLPEAVKLLMRDTVTTITRPSR